MNHPNPNDIQAQPPERRLEEIQAHRPAPRSEDQPQLPDYDFKKRWSWAPEFGELRLMMLAVRDMWLVLLLALPLIGLFVFCLMQFHYGGRPP